MGGAATETDFGPEPEALLSERVDWLDPSRPVLDLGCGLGRNLLYLARRGFRCVGLEPDRAVARQVEEAAGGLPVRIEGSPFQDFRPPERFGTGLAFGLLPVLEPEDRDRLVQLLPTWTAAGGLVFLTGFTDQLDPGKWPGELRPGEIRELLPAGELLVHEEVIGTLHRHGDGPEHRHAWARAVFRL